VSRRSSNALTRPIFRATSIGAAALLAVLLLALTPVAGAATSGPCGNSTASPRQLTLHQMRASELCLINRVRVHYGLHPLAFNPELRDSATGHSDSMVTHHYFAHEGPGGSMDSRITRAGYLRSAGAFTVGENIGGGAGRRFGSPMAVFKEWMHSPPHRANILDPGFRDAGVGVARGYPMGGTHASTATYTVDFGARSR
jgi:uncharacterized protein YkwD